MSSPRPQAVPTEPAQPVAAPTPRHDRRTPAHGRAAGIADRLGAEPRTVDDLTRREGTRALGLGRLAVTLASLVAAILSPEVEPALWAWVGLGLVWAVVSNSGVLPLPLPRLPLLFCSIVDGIFIATAFPLTGGVFSLLVLPLIAMPPLLTLSYAPRQTVLLPLIPFAGFALSALPDLLDGRDDAARMFAVVTVAIAASTVVATVGSRTRDRAAARTRELYALRRGLLAQALAAEERASRRLSEALHDHALQTLLAAAQDLEEVTPADDASRTTLLHAKRNLADGVADLRRTVRQMHPITLSSGGLAGAIAQLTHDLAQRAGFEPVVDVDEDACGLQDELVFSLVRELVTNASKHADADQVVVRLETSGRWVDLEVVDDGTGMSDDRQQDAVDAGHIGLASTRERVEAAGGWMSVESSRGAGTAVRVRLPI